MADMSREEAAQLLWRVAYDKYGMDDNPMRQREAADIVVAALRGWVKTADRLPEGDEHDEILGLYKGTGYLLYDIVQIGWLRLHPEMYVYWTHLPGKPEAES
jgi:hypothetical protein